MPMHVTTLHVRMLTCMRIHVSTHNFFHEYVICDNLVHSSFVLVESLLPQQSVHLKTHICRQPVVAFSEMEETHRPSLDEATGHQAREPDSWQQQLQVQWK